MPKQFYPWSNNYSTPFPLEKTQAAALGDSHSSILKKQAGVSDEKVLL